MQINPRSLDEIEAGFETLAIDCSRYDELLHEIATRKMKSWKEYADEIVEKLAAYSSEGDRAARNVATSCRVSASVILSPRPLSRRNGNGPSCGRRLPRCNLHGLRV